MKLAAWVALASLPVIITICVVIFTRKKTSDGGDNAGGDGAGDGGAGDGGADGTSSLVTTWNKYNITFVTDEDNPTKEEFKPLVGRLLTGRKVAEGQHTVEDAATYWTDVNWTVEASDENTYTLTIEGMYEGGTDGEAGFRYQALEDEKIALKSVQWKKWPLRSQAFFNTTVTEQGPDSQNTVWWSDNSSVIIPEVCSHMFSATWFTAENGMGDLVASLDVSHVTDFRSMFSSCVGIKDTPAGKAGSSIEDWDVSKGTTFSQMFLYVDLEQSMDLAGWQNTLDPIVSQMFYKAENESVLPEELQPTWAVSG